MNCIGTRITKNYCWELGFFYFIRKFSDGVSWISFEIKSDWWEGDHNPQHSVQLVILNFLIFEFRIYNIDHVEKENTKEFKVECPECKSPMSVRMELVIAP